tara:strand:+ start:747 stop:1241 length:495 start_codon:yes stop_codon:yes gene_type:complete
MKLIDVYSINEIKFPVHNIPENTLERDGILWYGDLIIDDRNQPGDTLGTRRLMSPHKKKVMKNSYRNIIDFIKKGKVGHYIDREGTVFKYNKSTNLRLVSKKIVSTKFVNDYCVVRLEGVNSPYILQSVPPGGSSWARVLYLGDFPWLIYCFSDRKEKNTYRKV